MRSLVAIMLVVILPTQSLASNRFVCRNNHCFKPAVKVVKAVAAPVYPQTIIQNQQVFYPVGQELRYQQTPAIAHAQHQQLVRTFSRLTDQMTEYQAGIAQQPQQITLHVQLHGAQQGVAYGQQTTTTATTANCGPEGMPQQPAFSNTMRPSGAPLACAQCHSGTTAKKGFRMDLPMSCEDKFKALAKVIEGTMPPDTDFSEQQFAQFFNELRLVETVRGNQPEALPPELEGQQTYRQPVAVPVPQYVPVPVPTRPHDHDRDRDRDRDDHDRDRDRDRDDRDRDRDRDRDPAPPVPPQAPPQNPPAPPQAPSPVPPAPPVPPQSDRPSLQPPRDQQPPAEENAAPPFSQIKPGQSVTPEQVLQMLSLLGVKSSVQKGGDP